MVLGVPETASAAAPTVSSDHAQISQLEQRIAAQGQAAEQIVEHYNDVAAKLGAINKTIAADQARLGHDKVAMSLAAVHLRTVAVSAYVNAQFGNSSTVASYAGTGTATVAEEKNVYLGTASGNLTSATAILQNDQQSTAAVERSLRAEQAETVAVLEELSASHRAAEQAVSADQSTLSRVNGNLLALVTAASRRREQQREEEAEQAIAEATAQQSSGQSGATSPIAVTATPGSYANPLRGLSGLSPERIDQGVDFQGFGPIYAIGDGVVISTYNGGWPGGTFISYQLTDGPATGLVVYAAEDIEPTVSVGQHVTSSTVIGRVYEGYFGIEVGWADSSGDGTTMAADNGQYYGSNTTAFGVNFSSLLRSLGAPGGQVESSPTGTLPVAWPHW